MAGYKIGIGLGIILVVTNFFCLCTSQCVIPNGTVSCGACIARKGCVWCSDPKFENRSHPAFFTFQRCNDLQYMRENQKCSEEFIEDPTSIEVSKTESKKDQNENGGNDGSQLSPERITLKLRVGDPFTFEMMYKDGGNRPLDLYYIMDLSATMNDDRITVATQSNALVEALKGLTKDVYLGFGSFIDKPMMPYATVIHLSGEYTSNGTTFVAPYLFKNHLSLTKNETEFRETISKANISVNLDTPEGGLEALMQALVCTEKIGWRNDSRKLVIVSTDGTFHIAGDGKLAGLSRPHDSQCHMPNFADYTHGTILDYPSISQVDAKVSENNIYVIFAVVEEHATLYEKLKEKIKSSSVVVLSGNSSDVVEKITQEYAKISSTLNIRQSWEKAQNKLNITYSGTCPGSDTTKATDFVWSDNNPEGCLNFPVNQELKINVTVELLGCVTKKPFNVTIYQSELSERPLILTIEPICECSECKKNKNATKENATECSSQGNLECGKCTCYEGLSRRNCHCQKHSTDVTGNEDADDIKKCTKNSQVCSGKERGVCLCGNCTCVKDITGYSKYSGKYCQYDEDDCKSSTNGQLCSGNGNCNEAKCTCKEGWTGDKCECRTKSCEDPLNPLNVTCNGRGSCSCKSDERCACEDGFSGTFCENEPGKQHVRSNCHEEEIIKCAKCVASLDEKARPQASSSCAKDCRLGQNKILIGVRDCTTNPSTCSFKDSKDCDREFVHCLNNTGEETGWTLNIDILETKSCPLPAPQIILIGVFSVVLIGIFLLLIWKVVTVVHDRREFERFQKEISGAAWGQAMNPLYKGAESNFQNPAYQK